MKKLIFKKKWGTLLALSGLISSSSLAIAADADFTPSNLDPSIALLHHSSKNPSNCVSQIFRDILRSQKVVPNLIVTTAYWGKERNPNDGYYVTMDTKYMEWDKSEQTLFFGFNYQMEDTKNAPHYYGAFEAILQNTYNANTQKYEETACHLVLQDISSGIIRKTNAIAQLPDGSIFKIKADVNKVQRTETISTLGDSKLEMQINGQFVKITLVTDRDHKNVTEVLHGQWINSDELQGYLTNHWWNDVTDTDEQLLGLIGERQSDKLPISSGELNRFVQLLDSNLRKTLSETVLNSLFPVARENETYFEKIQDFYDIDVTKTKSPPLN